MEIRPLLAATGEAPDLAELIPETKSLSVMRVLILMVGFSEGLTHLATLAIYYLFKDDLGLAPSEVSLLFVAPSLPWFLKPLLAFFSDSYPIFGMRRKPYVIFFSACQALGYVLLANCVTDIVTAVIVLSFIALSAAFCSAIAEALVVEISDAEEGGATRNVTNFTFAKGIGSLLVAYFSGYLLEHVSKQEVFLMTAWFPLLITFTALFMVDVSESPRKSISEQVAALLEFLQQKLIWGPLVFVLAFMCGPDYDDALFFYYTNILNFGPSFMGTLRFTYGFAAIAGIGLYQYVLCSYPYRQVLGMSILFSLPIYLSPLLLISGLNLKMGISDKVFVLSGGFLNEAVAEIQLLPLLVLTASICPTGLEGSAYSTMLAVRYLGSAVSKVTSSIGMSVLSITASNFDALMSFIWICGLFNLLPFLFINLIPTEEEISVAMVRKSESKMIEKGPSNLSERTLVYSRTSARSSARSQHE